METFSEKQVIVAGAGRSGLLAARLLAGEGARVTLRDDRSRADVEASLREYAVALVAKSRTLGAVELGGSPRASIYLIEAARARAYLEQRDYVLPEDVKRVAPAVLRHRLLLSYEAEAEGQTSDAIIRELLAAVPTP